MNDYVLYYVDTGAKIYRVLSRLQSAVGWTMQRYYEL
jgi:hypothetical protein